MLSSRRPLAILLAVVMIFTMLVPVAMAAPEWAHGISIISPTTEAPAYVNPAQPDLSTDPGHQNDVQGDNWFWAKYDIDIVGLQVDDVSVSYRLVQNYKPDWPILDTVLLYWETKPAAAFVADSTNSFWYKFVVPTWSPFIGKIQEGWYALQICVVDQDPDRPLFCDTQENAVLVQDSGPMADLEKPGVEEWQGATFVTGKAYLMVGKAWDNWGIKKVEFQYCDWSNNPTHCNMKDPGWIKVADGVPTANVPNQWQATWDTTRVPDDFGAIRMCATNFVGLSNCGTGPDNFVGRPDAHLVWVTNRFVVDLEPEWNLISLPAMPYDAKIESVLSHLIAHKTVLAVATFTPKAGGLGVEQKLWTPAYVGGPQEFNTMKAGQGYWIKMAAEEDLTVVGTYLALPPNGPQEYPVGVGWNLIGYTHFGRPWWYGDTIAADYLGTFNALHAQALWKYNATTEVYEEQLMLDPMTKGAGFWLAMDQAGVIRP
jgi:hypothetical protein